MLSTYTPQLRLDAAHTDMHGIEYESSSLPFDYDDDNDKVEEAEMMEEVVETPDLYHVVITDLDMGNDGIQTLVSMAKTPNAAEKVNDMTCR